MGYSKALTLNWPYSFINSKFSQFSNGSYYSMFNSAMLNSTELVINQSIASNSPNIPGPLFATLAAFNATGSVNSSETGSQESGSTSNGGNSSQRTGLAM